MIPFAVLCGKIEFEEGELEIRILELSRDYFTLRLPKKISLQNRNPMAFLLYFFSRKNNCYEKCRINNFKIEELQQLEFFNEYRVEILDEKFEKLSEIFSKEYMNYIEEKLSGQIDEINSTGNYAPSFEDQLRSKMPAFFEKLRGKNIYLSLSEDEIIDRYLKSEKSEFIENYLTSNYCPGEFLKEIKVEGLVLGNRFCKHLLPSSMNTERVLNKAAEDGLEVIFMLPKAMEEDIENFIERIKFLTEKNVKIIINDLGLFEKYKELYPNLYKGPLQNKSLKDPRIMWGATPDFATGRDRLVFLPFYQTNNSAHCVLRAALLHGDRGRDGNENTCEKYCKNRHFLYPVETGIFHRYNSLFGLVENFETNPEDILVLELE